MCTPFSKIPDLKKNLVEGDEEEWKKKFIEAKLSMEVFSNDKFFGYSDSEIQKVIDGAMKEDKAPLQKKVQQASNFSNDLSKNIDEIDCLLKDTINLRGYPEATRLSLNAISDEIK
jgi:hypothetical protein